MGSDQGGTRMGTHPASQAGPAGRPGAGVIRPSVGTGVGTGVGPGGGAVSPWGAISRLSALGEQVPVAGVLRVSQAELQNVAESCQRQIANCLAALPAGW